jgi:hypothetical protein
MMNLDIKHVSLIVGLVIAVGSPIFVYGQLTNQVDENKSDITEVKKDLGDDMKILRREQEIVREDIKELLRNSNELKQILQGNN